MNNLHVKTGDNVMIISGKDKGHTGKVLQVSPSENKVIVEGQNMVTKHVKPRRQGEQGGIVKAEGAMYASKVMPVCPKCGKAVRVGHVEKDGCWLFFGKETAGLPEPFRVAHYERCIRLPMRKEARSLNLSNSVAILTYEALRQTGFPGLKHEGEMLEKT